MAFAGVQGGGSHPNGVGFSWGGDSHPGGVGLAGPQGWREEWQSRGFRSSDAPDASSARQWWESGSGNVQVVTGQGLDPGAHRNGTG